jgi:phosphate:Na+ symporter
LGFLRSLVRLREGRPESIETSSLHLDILRDLRRIHSHICSVAYPVLEAAGEIPSRERVTTDMAADALAYRPGQTDVG